MGDVVTELGKIHCIGDMRAIVLKWTRRRQTKNLLREYKPKAGSDTIGRDVANHGVLRVGDPEGGRGAILELVKLVVAGNHGVSVAVAFRRLDRSDRQVV